MSKQLKSKSKTTTLRQRLDAANAAGDVLEAFAPFRRFHRGGLEFAIANRHAPALPAATREAIVGLFEANMRAQYEASDWGYDPAAKREELFEADARYLLATTTTTPITNADNAATTSSDSDKATGLVGFVHFRFLEDDGAAVLYVYEIQIAAAARRRGLGKFLMQLLQLVARKQGMELVVLTVFKANVGAMRFYRETLGFEIDETSPSACGDPTQSYEILSKRVDGGGGGTTSSSSGNR